MNGTCSSPDSSAGATSSGSDTESGGVGRVSRFPETGAVASVSWYASLSTTASGGTPGPLLPRGDLVFAEGVVGIGHRDG